MALKGGITIDGVRELQKNLRQLDVDAMKEFRQDLIAIGQDIVHDAQGHIPVKTGRALQSMKASADLKGAYVQGGRNSVPYYAWLDFGGTLRPTGGRRNTITRPHIRRGRYLFPAIDRHLDQIERQAVDAVETAITKNNL